MKQILLFTKQGCSGCQKIKEELRRNKIPFTEMAAETIDGFAAAAFYDVFVYPALLVVIDDRVVFKYHGKMPSPDVLNTATWRWWG